MGKHERAQGQNEGGSETSSVRQSAHVWYAPGKRIESRFLAPLAAGKTIVLEVRMFAPLFGAWLCLGLQTGAVSKPDLAGKLSRFEFTEMHMGCSFNMVLYSTDADVAIRASRLAFARIAKLDAVLSDYEPGSELSRLSLKAGGFPVPISADLFDVLEKSKYFYARTNGAFDVTIAPVGRLWRRARRDRRLPDSEKLAEARALVGADKLVLDAKNHTAQLLKPGMRLDVGGIAKGYAAGAAIDVLRNQGITRALVGGAGDIVVAEAPPDAAGWTIAIAGLSPAQSEPETYVLLSNAAISTAGDAERFVVIDGHRYSHIVNPVTGMAAGDRASVTVVAADGATADALDTSVYLMGPERGMKLIEEIPGTAAFYVRLTPAGVQTIESSRFKQIPRARPKDTRLAR
jgi:thiamine biosynthesis lipoprotein